MSEHRTGSSASEELYQALRRTDRIVRIVVGARERCAREGLPAYDSAYDKFMWNIIGHPHLWPKAGSFPQIRRGDVLYDQPVSSSYSQKGNIIHIRKTEQDVDPSSHYFVASMNLRRGDYTEWSVIREKYGTFNGVRGNELVLSPRPIYGLPSEPERVVSGNVLEDVLAEDEIYDEVEAYEAARPRRISTTQGGWFVPEHGAAAEELVPIGEAHHKLAEFYRRHGALLAHVSYEVEMVPVKLAVV